nr:hypothetical protein [Nocardioides daphniae]
MPSTAAAPRLPHKATMKLVPPAPTQGTHPASGVSITVQANRVQGNPPSGHVDMTDSTATHHAAIHNGQA